MLLHWGSLTICDKPRPVYVLLLMGAVSLRWRATQLFCTVVVVKSDMCCKQKLQLWACMRRYFRAGRVVSEQDKWPALHCMHGRAVSSLMLQACSVRVHVQL